MSKLQAMAKLLNLGLVVLTLISTTVQAAASDFKSCTVATLEASPGTLDVVFALKLPPQADDAAHLAEVLEAISTPGRSNYGKWWTRAQANALFAPDEAARRAVLDFVNTTGGQVIGGDDDDDAAAASGSTGTGFVCARYPLHSVPAAFGVPTLSCFEHKSRSKSVGAVWRSAQSPRLPSPLDQAVSFVSGITGSFPRVRPSPAPSLESDNRAGPFKVTPEVIRRQYNAGPAALNQSSKQRIAVASFLKQYYSPADLAQFQTQNALPSAPVGQLWGHNNASLPGIEASLDVQFLFGVADRIDSAVYSTPGEQPGNPGSEPFLAWLAFVLSQPVLPSVISISYQDYEDTVNPEYAQRVNAEFARLSLQGITLVTGSGDWGVGCAADGHTFRADFPSSSPYVVSTGATTFCTDEAGPQCTLPTPFRYPLAEKGVTFSSGGFSNFFAQPDYQQGAVEAFLSKHSNVSRDLFNASGRAFPDVSALGVNFQVVYKGDTRGVAGTSASTPTFAAIVALLNEARLQDGKPTMGWIQPFLYQTASSHPSAFHDVTEGNNGFGNCSGFDAAPGWDPMTGLGTPNFAVLRAAALEC